MFQFPIYNSDTDTVVVCPFREFRRRNKFTHNLHENQFACNLQIVPEIMVRPLCHFVGGRLTVQETETKLTAPESDLIIFVLS